MDIAIPVSLDAADADGSMCLSAQLQQGDATATDQRLTVALEQRPSGPAIHVRSAAVIEEPVVNLTVQAGCSTTTNRNFTLLADVPSGNELPTAVYVPAPAASPALQAQRAATRQAALRSGGNGGVAGSGSSGGATGSSRSGAADSDSSAAAEAEAPRRPRRPAAEAAPPRPRTVVARAAPAPRPAAPAAQPVAAPAPKEANAAAGKPRLQVDALDPATAAVGNLKPSTDLQLPDAPDPARRAAAAELWSALDPAAAQAKRDADRTKELEAALVALREQSAQNQRTLLAVQSELAEARDSRYRNPLVYALLLLLLIALIALALLWRMARRAAAPAWWREELPPAAENARPRTHSGLLDDEAAGEEDDDPPVRPGEPRTFVPTPFAPLEPEAGAADSGPDEPVVLPLHHADGSPVRQVNTEELFDVQQQSDFFLSLGQHEQAIAVLREHIASNPGTSALAYLDLLRIYHALDRKDEYARLAEEFERVFNADVPEFDHFAEVGRGLENYRAALSRIEAQWPAPSTLALIEELVFRRPGSQEEGAFDLAAYQELLLLYSIAKEVIDPENAAPAASAPATLTAPLSALVPASAPARTPAPAVLQPVQPAVAATTMTAPIDPPIDPPVGPPVGPPMDPPTAVPTAVPYAQWPNSEFAPATASMTLPAAVAPRDWPASAAAAAETSPSAPAVLPDGPTLPPSLYGSIDANLGMETVLSPDTPPTTIPGIAEPMPAPARPKPDADFAQFDRTAYETMPTPIETPKPAPAVDPHVIDFELFDPETEAEIAPRPIKR